MPVAAIKPGHRISASFPYPPSGRARVYLEASYPVDAVISTRQMVEQITSIQSAAALAPAILIYNSRWQMDEIVNLPPTWSSVGWSITVGHPGLHAEPIGVYLVVYPA